MLVGKPGLDGRSGGAEPAAGVARVYTPKDDEIQAIMNDLLEIARWSMSGRRKHAKLALSAGGAQIHRMIPPRDIDELKSALAAMLPELKSRWPLSYLGVFGSWARREHRAESDLDLLVDLDRPIGFEIVALKDELERRLGLRVDLVMRGSLRRRIGRRILDEVQPV